MRRRVGILAVLLAVLVSGWMLPVAAQDALPTAPAKPGPEVIPQSDIPLRADADDDVDETDLDEFADCATGPGIPLDQDNPPAGCEL